MDQSTDCWKTKFGLPLRGNRANWLNRSYLGGIKPGGLCFLVAAAILLVPSETVHSCPQNGVKGIERPSQIIGGNRSDSKQPSFGFGPRAGASSDFGPRAGSSSDDSSSADTTIGGNTEASETNSVFDRLVEEIELMIPADLEKSPQRKKLVEDAIKAFQERKAEKTIELFDQLKASDPSYMPPSDLLLASLSFIIKDKSSGRILLERAASNNPDNMGVSAAFARLAVNEGRVTDASLHLEKLERLVNSPEVSAEVGKFYASQLLDGKVDVAMRRKRYTEARELLAQQREQSPDSTKVQMVSAELEFWEKNIDKSLEYLRTLKSMKPKARVPESIIASWYRKTGDFPSSDKWLVDAAKKYPRDPQVQLEYASLAINREDFELATKTIAIAEEASSETLFSKNLKAKIAFAKGSYADAAVKFQKIAVANPANIDAANMLALSLIESVDETTRKKAVQIAVNNYRKSPNNLVVRSALGYIYLRTGNLDQAKSALAVGAGSKRGASPEVDFFVASVLKEMNQKENARRVLDSAVQHKGFFLYRLPAKKLLSELGGPLPTSTTKN